MKKGNLFVVGTGILTPAHLSQESISAIKIADIVHVLVPDPLGLTTIKKLNSNVKNLGDLYFSGCNRQHSYNIMVDVILDDVRSGLKVCAIFYGHPGVFAYPSHKSIKIAKQEGFEAQMLPSISAEDCLYADLGIDPGDYGCQSYEATQLMFYNHSINPFSALIVWQIGVAGDVTLKQLAPANNGVEMLKQRLLEWYPEEHPVILYEASNVPLLPPRIENLKLADLCEVEVTTISTIYLKPISYPTLNKKFCDKYHIDTSSL